MFVVASTELCSTCISEVFVRVYDEASRARKYTGRRKIGRRTIGSELELNNNCAI